jgi:biotin carboxyl carrier protein
MKLTAEISGKTVELQIVKQGTQVAAEVEGRRYELEARALRDGVYLLLTDGRVHECRVHRADATPGTLEVTTNNRTYSVVLSDPKRLRGGGSRSVHSDAAAEIVAPMPGKVVRVLVEAGSEIEAGAGIVVVEAMKMQNALKSPKAGKIASINVVAGETVNAGQVLAVVE